MPQSPLSPPAILATMADAIPIHLPGDTTSDVGSSYEVLALFVHAAMTNLGFQLKSFDEDHHEDDRFAKLAPRLDATWNARFGSHTFVYSIPSTTQTHTLKVDRLGNMVEVRATSSGSDDIFRFQKPVRDIVRSSTLPIRITVGDDGQEDRSNIVANLRQAFVSEDAMIDFGALVKTEIIQYLGSGASVGAGRQDPDDRAAADSAEDEIRAQAGTQAFAQRPPRRGQQPGIDSEIADPFGAPPRGPNPLGDFPPPGFEDEHQVLQPSRGEPGGFGPPQIGRDDLNPAGLGPDAALRPWLGPVGGFGEGGISGMHPTFGDPLFAGPRGGRGGAGQGPRVPPGARWDPLGPPGPKFGGPGGRDNGQSGGLGGGFRGGFSGDIV